MNLCMNDDPVEGFSVLAERIQCGDVQVVMRTRHPKSGNRSDVEDDSFRLILFLQVLSSFCVCYRIPLLFLDRCYECN
jgi:hypothetical protein